MKKNIVLLLSLLISSLAVTQNINISWQLCLGTNESDYPDCIVNTHNGFLLSIGIISEGDGISNYHGSADAWLVELDTLGNVIWEKCFGGSGGESFTKIIPLPDNEYYLFGGTNSSDGDIQSNIHDSYDLWVVKIDSANEIIWERCLGSYIHDSPKDITLTTDGGVLVLGSIASSGGDITNHYGKTDAWLCRLDYDGNILWEKTYGGPNDDKLLKIVPTAHNTYVLVGDFYTSEGLIDCQKDDSPAQKDVWLLEIDMFGNVLWQNCYGGSYWDEGFEVIATDEGYLFLALTNSNDGDVSGLHGPPGSFSDDIWVVKTDLSGNIIWQNCLGGSDFESPRSIYKYSDSEEYMLFGTTRSNDGDVSGNHNTNEDTPDIWVVKLDSVGQLIWQQCFGSITYETLPMHGVAKKDDYTYALNVESYGEEGDVLCHISQPWGYDAWVFQIKDCNHYAPAQPKQPTGKDTICVNTDSTITYTTTPATNAWYYEWQMEPEEAGIVSQDSVSTTIHWNPTHEGRATLKVRSTNDCGESAWSDSLVIQTYMCLGTEENTSQNNFRVYPNPATSTLIVDIDNFNAFQKLKIEIYNSLGYMVYGNEVADNITSIDVSVWNNGIYVVRVLGSDGTVGFKKIVIN